MGRLKWWLDFLRFWRYRYILTEQGILKQERNQNRTYYINPDVFDDE